LAAGHTDAEGDEEICAIRDDALYNPRVARCFAGNVNCSREAAMPDITPPDSDADRSARQNGLLRAVRMQRWIMRVAMLAMGATIVVMPRLPKDLVPLGMMLVLAVLGTAILVDIDVTARVKQPHPLPWYAASLLLGLLSGVILHLPCQRSPSWLMPLALLAIQMLLYFLLVALSLPVRVTEQFSGALSVLLCLQGYLLVSPLPFLGLPIGPQGQPFPLDLNAVVILISGLVGASVGSMGQERDPIPLERLYVLLWAGVSALILFLWWLVVAR
jgi:hypothetical protein